MKTIGFNNSISERDMDMLIAESVLTDPDFCQVLIAKTDLKGNPVQVLSAELSKTDSVLGESDITIIICVNGAKYGLLIEDKIDAIAMPGQHDRYLKRGEKGIKEGDFEGFRVFIFCPKKYFENNAEAKFYEHFFSYEECKAYFDTKSDPWSRFRSQQLEQVLNIVRKPAVLNVDERANTFLKQYIEYQKEHYPSLDLRTKDDKNGWWTDYRTELGSAYITHKIQEGYVDLTFSKASDKMDQVKIIADWARHHRLNVTVIRTKKSAMLRVRVPKIDMLRGFESIDIDELNQCFDAIKEFTDFANIVELTSSVVLKRIDNPS